MDLLSAVFLGCFVFGLAAALGSFLLGGLDSFDLGGHGFDFGAPDAAGDAHGPFPVNASTVLAFLAWFGGAGFVLHHYYGVAAGLSVILAGGVGLIGALLVFLFLLKVLLPNQTVMRQGDYEVVGSVGRITSPIREGGVGEVVYTRGGTRRSLGARSLDGRALERGAEVVIAKYERGVALVQPWDEYVARERSLDAAEGTG